MYSDVMVINSYDDLKKAVNTAIQQRGRSRTSFARDVAAHGHLNATTVQCLLSSAPVIGARVASFESALRIVEEAGMSLAVVPRVE